MGYRWEGKRLVTDTEYFGIYEDIPALVKEVFNFIGNLLMVFTPTSLAIYFGIILIGGGPGFLIGLIVGVLITAFFHRILLKIFTVVAYIGTMGLFLWMLCLLIPLIWAI